MIMNDITRVLQSSLLEYQNTEENLFNEIIKQSLITLEEDKKRILHKAIEIQKEEDIILANTIKESHMSNVCSSNKF